MQEKTFDEIQHAFMMKTLGKPGIEENFLNMIKKIYKKLTANIIPNGERPKAFLLRSIKQFHIRCSSSPSSQHLRRYSGPTGQLESAPRKAIALC